MRGFFYKYCSLFIFFLSSLPCFGQAEVVDWKEKELIGNVRLLIERNFKIQSDLNGDQKKIKDGGDYYVFNHQGKSVKAGILFPDKSNYEKYLYSYNKKGSIIECDYLIEKDSTTRVAQIFKYNKAGKIIESRYYTIDYGEYMKEIYQYDKKKNSMLKSTLGIDSIDNVDKLFCQYDKKGRKLYERVYSSGKHPMPPKDSCSYKYDKKGKLIERDIYESTGSDTLKSIYKYNGGENIIEEDHSERDTLLGWKVLFQYNIKGELMVKQEIDGLGKRQSVIRYTYSYEHDKNGNWVKKTGYQNNEPVSITEREIVYY